MTTSSSLQEPLLESALLNSSLPFPSPPPALSPSEFLDALLSRYLGEKLEKLEKVNPTQQTRLSQLKTTINTVKEKGEVCATLAKNKIGANNKSVMNKSSLLSKTPDKRGGSKSAGASRSITPSKKIATPLKKTTLTPAKKNIAPTGSKTQTTSRRTVTPSQSTTTLGAKTRGKSTMSAASTKANTSTTKSQMSKTVSGISGPTGRNVRSSKIIKIVAGKGNNLKANESNNSFNSKKKENNAKTIKEASASSPNKIEKIPSSLVLEEVKDVQGQLADVLGKVEEMSQNMINYNKPKLLHQVSFQPMNLNSAGSEGKSQKTPREEDFANLNNKSPSFKYANGKPNVENMDEKFDEQKLNQKINQRISEIINEKSILDRSSDTIEGKEKDEQKQQQKRKLKNPLQINLGQEEIKKTEKNDKFEELKKKSREQRPDSQTTKTPSERAVQVDDHPPSDPPNSHRNEFLDDDVNQKIRDYSEEKTQKSLEISEISNPNNNTFKSSTQSQQRMEKFDRTEKIEKLDKLEKSVKLPANDPSLLPIEGKPLFSESSEKSYDLDQIPPLFERKKGVPDVEEGHKRKEKSLDFLKKKMYLAKFESLQIPNVTIPLQDEEKNNELNKKKLETSKTELSVLSNSDKKKIDDIIINKTPKVAKKRVKSPETNIIVDGIKSPKSPRNVKKRESPKQADSKEKKGWSSPHLTLEKIRLEKNGPSPFEAEGNMILESEEKVKNDRAANETSENIGNSNSNFEYESDVIDGEEEDEEEVYEEEGNSEEGIIEEEEIEEEELKDDSKNEIRNSQNSQKKEKSEQKETNIKITQKTTDKKTNILLGDKISSDSSLENIVRPPVSQSSFSQSKEMTKSDSQIQEKEKINSRQEIGKKSEYHNSKPENDKDKEQEVLSKKDLNFEEKNLSSAKSQDLKITSEKKSKASISSLNELRELDKAERKFETILTEKQENGEKNEKIQNKINGEKERRSDLLKNQKLDLQPIIENHSFIENLISDRDKILQGINNEIGEILLKNKIKIPTKLEDFSFSFMSQSALVLVEFNFYDELTKLGTNSKVNRLLKALFIVLDLMHPKLCSQEFWNFSMNFLSEYKENIDKLIEKIGKVQNMKIYNKMKLEKMIKKHPFILFPKNFDKLSSFAEFLSFLIFDLSIYNGLVELNGKLKITDENRIFYLNEKRTFLMKEI